MARKKPHEEHENHERWLVSYADFITLLFAFFVVMYSISSVNEGKYRVLSDALASAFRSSQKSMRPIQIGSTVKSPTNAVAAPQVMQSPRLISTPSNFQRIKGGSGDDESGRASGQGQGGLDRLSRKVAKVMARLIDEGLVAIHRKKNWVEVEIKDRFLFRKGTVTLQPKARVMLDKVARVLNEVANPIRIEGYTDDQKVHNKRYHSNWELSLGRAATVIQRFEQQSVSPWRLSASGFGAFRPVASNSTPEGRARNRRVVIVIMASRAIERAYERQKADEARYRHEQQLQALKAEAAAFASQQKNLLSEASKTVKTRSVSVQKAGVDARHVAKGVVADVRVGAESEASTSRTVKGVPVPERLPARSVGNHDRPDAFIPPIRFEAPIRLPLGSAQNGTQ